MKFPLSTLLTTLVVVAVSASSASPPSTSPVNLVEIDWSAGFSSITNAYTASLAVNNYAATGLTFRVTDDTATGSDLLAVCGAHDDCASVALPRDADLDKMTFETRVVHHRTLTTARRPQTTLTIKIPSLRKQRTASAAQHAHHLHKHNNHRGSVSTSASAPECDDASNVAPTRTAAWKHKLKRHRASTRAHAQHRAKAAARHRAVKQQQQQRKAASAQKKWKKAARLVENAQRATTRAPAPVPAPKARVEPTPIEQIERAFATLLREMQTF